MIVVVTKLPSTSGYPKPWLQISSAWFLDVCCLAYLVEISWCSAACWRRRLTCCFRFPRLLSSTSLSRSNQCVNAVFYAFLPFYFFSQRPLSTLAESGPLMRAVLWSLPSTDWLLHRCMVLAFLKFGSRDRSFFRIIAVSNTVIYSYSINYSLHHPHHSQCCLM